MGAYSHLIEIRKFLDKCLVCDIQVENITLSIAGVHVETNRWLHLEDWLEIDVAVDSLLHRFRHSEILEGFDTQVLDLGSFRVHCKKIRLSSAYKKILGSDKTLLPIGLSIKVSKINTKALLEQIANFENELSQLKHDTNRPLKSKNIKLVHHENTREYDPTTNNVGAEQASNEYIPYTASVKTPNGPTTIDTSGVDLNENEPYSPKPVLESSPDQIAESPNEIPTYKPARIAKNKHAGGPDDISENPDKQEKEEPPQSTRIGQRKRSPAKSSCSTSPSRNHRDKHYSSKRPKTTNAELFGSDDSDQEPVKSPVLVAAVKASESPKRIATPVRTPSNSDQLHQESKRKRYKLRHESTHKNPLDAWLSKSSIKTDKPNGKPPKKTSSRNPSTTEVRPEITKTSDEEMVKHQNLVELKQIKELSALRDIIKSKRKSPPPVMEILSLTHLSTKDILETFKEIKPIIDDIFAIYSKKTKITGFNGINHLKTIMLIDDKKQLQMMNFLREHYQPEEKGVPTLTDLYINALVPEWTLNVFMNEFKFTRRDAIERLQAQEEFSVYHNNESLDLSDPL